MKKALIALFLILALLLSACAASGLGQGTGNGGELGNPPASDPPASDPPASEPPASDPPASEPPATEPPATEPPATEPPVSEPERTAELIAMEEMFKSGKENWYNYALTCYFEDATKVDLSEIFYNGFDGVSAAGLTDAEKEVFKDVINLNEVGDVTRLPVDKMDAVLQKYFGVKLEQISWNNGEGGLWYAASLNSYYMFHNDANGVMDFTFNSMETAADGTIKINYTTATYETCPTGVLTLKLVGDTYQVLSNQPR